MHCTQCGVENQDAARFCQSCGAALAAAESAEPVPAPVSASSVPVAALVVIGVLVLVVVLLAGMLMAHRIDIAREKAQIEATNQLAVEVKTPPAPAEDPVADAQVVLDNYLAADLGHDGNEMKKYLGGQAAARFVAEVQGQENLTVHSQQVSDHAVKDDNTIDFSVEVKWSPEGSNEVRTQTDRYVLKRTDAGWKITSTPAYPE